MYIYTKSGVLRDFYFPMKKCLRETKPIAIFYLVILFHVYNFVKYSVMGKREMFAFDEGETA